MTTRQKSSSRSNRSCSLETRRLTTGQTRRPPACAFRLIIQPDGQQRRCPIPGNTDVSDDRVLPTEIWLNLTLREQDNQAEPRSQFDSRLWFDSAVGKWANQDVTVHIVSFGAAMVRSGLLDRLVCLQDERHRWRVILVGDGADLTSTANIDKILRSCLCELQMYPAGLGDRTVNVRVLNAVKDLIDLRASRMQNRPRIIFRVCAGGPQTVELTHWSRQVRLDRLDITDRDTEERRLWP